MPGPVSDSYAGPGDVYKPVPVRWAKDIADLHDKAAVVIIAYDKRAGCMHYTTYGQEAMDKVSAANLAEQISRYLGGGAEPLRRFEDFRNITQARAAQMREMLQRVAKEYAEAEWDSELLDEIRELMADPLPGEHEVKG